jgi:hypothetical protein
MTDQQDAALVKAINWSLVVLGLVVVGIFVWSMFPR